MTLVRPSRAPGYHPRVPRRLAALLFPLALWFLATFFLLGDLGKYNDDWFYLLRDPTTGDIQSLYLDRELQFWRPLYRLAVPSLMTLLWHAVWLNHLISAAAHGALALLLWRLLLTLRVPRAGAAIASLFFLVWPSYFEAVLWLCSLPTILSLILVVLAWLLQVRATRVKLGAWTLPVIFLLFFASACFNEQAASALAALPFLSLAAAPADRPRRSVFLRSLVPTAFAAASLLLYVAIHHSLGLRPPATDRASLFSSAAKMPAQLVGTLNWAKVQFTSIDFLERAFSAGLATLAAHPFRAAAIGAALAMSLLPWACSVGAAPASPASDLRRRAGLPSPGPPPSSPPCRRSSSSATGTTRGSSMPQALASPC
jgi:hypothetical protein